MNSECHSNSLHENIKSHLTEQFGREPTDEEFRKAFAEIMETAEASIFVGEYTIKVGPRELSNMVLSDAGTMRVLDEIEMLNRKRAELEAKPDRDWETEQHIRAIDSTIPHLIEGVERGVSRCRGTYEERLARRAAQANAQRRVRETRRLMWMLAHAPREGRQGRDRRVVRTATKKTVAKAAADPDGSNADLPKSASGIGDADSAKPATGGVS